VPGVLAEALIVPVAWLITNPTPALNVPPFVPFIITAISPPDEQMGGYWIVAVGVLLTDTVVVVVNTEQPPDAFIV